MSAVPASFGPIISPILVDEGGNKLTNNPLDRGGTTIWGITETIARACGYTGPMSAMTRDQAVAIYWTEFWVRPGLDKLYAVFPAMAAYVLSVGVTTGITVPMSLLQRGLNALSQGGVRYPMLAADGLCGPRTLAATQAYLAGRASEAGDQVLLGLVKGLVTAFYVALEETHPDDSSFEYGWIRARALGLP